MSVLTWLALASVLGVAALFVVLAVFLVKIAAELERIGGEQPAYGAQASYLSKIRFGVRAIETQTAALAPQVGRLNAGLSSVRDGIRAVDANLGGVITAVSRQEVR